MSHRLCADSGVMQGSRALLLCDALLASATCVHAAAVGDPQCTSPSGWSCAPSAREAEVAFHRLGTASTGEPFQLVAWVEWVIRVDAPHPRDETKGDFVMRRAVRRETGRGRTSFWGQAIGSEHRRVQRALQIDGWMTITGSWSASPLRATLVQGQPRRAVGALRRQRLAPAGVARKMQRPRRTGAHGSHHAVEA